MTRDSQEKQGRMSDSGLSIASSSASGPVSGEGDNMEAVEETETGECREYEEQEEEEVDNISDNIRSPAKRRAQARLTHGHGFLSKSVANLSSSEYRGHYCLYASNPDNVFVEC